MKDILGIAFLGFVYGMGFLALFGLLLQITLGVNISDFENSHRLLFLFWGGGAIGWHIYLKVQEERKMQEQLEKLRRGESVVGPRPGLIERYEKEREAENFMNERNKKIES